MRSATIATNKAMDDRQAARRLDVEFIVFSGFDISGREIATLNDP